mgnify:CR=1 FL=1
MDFLKDLFGGKPLTFEELVQAINAHNGNEANKEKQIKLANLGTGEYVGKGKYDADIEKVNNLLNTKQGELDAANILIGDLRKGTKGNEELQGKITNYESVVVPELQKQLAETKIKSALKIALVSEKALDVDYLTFKLNEKLKAEGKTLELDENEHIKGWDDIRSDLKTRFPAQFETAKTGKIEPNLLPQGKDDNGITQAQFNKMGYQSRLKLKQEQPEIYAQMTGKTTN